MLLFLELQVSPMPVQILPRPQLSSNSNHYWVIIFVIVVTNGGCFYALTCTVLVVVGLLPAA